jgi:hypothetical protein
MSARVILGKAVFTIRDADHLQVDGELVQIQRSGPRGFETVAVAGDDMLVIIEPAECAKVEIPPRTRQTATDGHHWQPVGEPLD